MTEFKPSAQHNAPRFPESVSRRNMILAGVAGAFVYPLASAQSSGEKSPVAFEPASMLGGLQEDSGESPILNAKWYRATQAGDGFEIRVPQGGLDSVKFLSADFLLDGSDTVVWVMHFYEDDPDRSFVFRFGGLNQCSFRMRMPLSLLDLNRWRIDREGAWLKPMCSGDRIDPRKVQRITFTVERKSSEPARWCMTAITGTTIEPPALTKPVLPKGPLLDELGQSRIRDWKGKANGTEECVNRIRDQHSRASSYKWPEGFTRWGGYRSMKLRDGTRFFSKQHDGKRWWLTDPDGCAFWSAGLDCVRVDATAAIQGLESALTWLPPRQGLFEGAFDGERGGFSYLASNLIRAFGPNGWREKWARTALGELRRLRVNTVGNWSEWDIAVDASVPYVRPLSFNPKRVSRIYRDFPDIFDNRFADDAADYADALGSTRDDPAFLGYFLMNEPTWGFSSELPAVGMMYTSPQCATRQELARDLGKKYSGSGDLSKAWNMEVTLEAVASGKWTKPFSKTAIADLEAFSTRMVEHYFRTLSEACRRVDSNHLNLGMRWAGVPPSWAVAGMKYFDVYSINNYRQQVPREFTEEIQRLLNMPTMIGEWHFGALDAGLPSSGIGHVKTQADRGRAYRWYVEDAMANPNCVGTHWFTLYDQSAAGRYDGENYNIGFLDTCHRPYDEICDAAIRSHEQMYALATGSVAPFADPPEYLPLLFI